MIRKTFQIVMRVRFAAVILFIFGIFATASGQENNSKLFLSIENNRVSILEKADEASRIVQDRTAYGSNKDTVAVLEKTDDFYRVQYFSTVTHIGEGWVKKGGGIDEFLLRPVYSLSGRYLKKAALPSEEERLNVISAHPEWGAIARLALADGLVVSGMTKEMIRAGFGEADEHIRYITGTVSADQWTYYLAPDQDFRLTFENNRLHVFEDRVLHSAVETEKRIIQERKEYFYPHRLTSLKIMLGGAILMVSGYNGLQHDKVLSIADAVNSQSRLVDNNNTANWLMIGVGFAAQVIGGYLFNYTPGIEFMVYPPLSMHNSGDTPMTGISIPLAFRK